MGKSTPPNYTRDQADAAVTALLNLAVAIREFDEHKDIFEEAPPQAKASRFATLTRSEKIVERHMKMCRDTAIELIRGVERLRRLEP